MSDSNSAIDARTPSKSFPVDVPVRALLGLAAGGHKNCAEARDLAAVHLLDVRSRIADLRRMERALATTVRACDAGDEAGCPLIDALEGKRLSKAGGDLLRREFAKQAASTEV